jgi:hypothetical protein
MDFCIYCAGVEILGITSSVKYLFTDLNASLLMIGIPVTMEVASDLLDRQGPIYREDTAVFVSRGRQQILSLLLIMLLKMERFVLG